MKSSIEQLKKRGYYTKESLSEFTNLDKKALFQLLFNENAEKRSIAAKIIGDRKITNGLPLLCELLKTEKKLYTKITLCETIEKFGTDSLKYLIPLIGKIGNNQYKKIELIDLKKTSYPLPRDIIIRIIIRIGSSSLKYLEDILLNGTYEQKVETIDAIGHIAFNFNDLQNQPVLLNLFKNNNDELIKWKIIRAFQSFNSSEIEIILNDIIKNDTNQVFVEEAKRSLSRIKKRNKNN